jgi:formylmethanofuran dehydrogenase subunit C
MALELIYRGDTSIPVEAEGITPDAVAGRSPSEISRSEIYCGNRKLPLGEMFAVSGHAGDGVMRWKGDLSGVHRIGAGMKGGTIHIAGSAGRHVGSEMQAGEIVVDGDAGDWLGGEMHGGSIHVEGSAGHLVGAAYRGSPRGMTGGTILIRGDAGNEIGHTMRRGLIAVGGRAGDLAGFSMRAGSILLFGENGMRYGAGMRRGTIALLGESPIGLLPSFRFACRYRPEILALVFAQLRQQQFPVSDDVLGARFDLYHGDLIEGGRGEILRRAAGHPE